MHACAHAEAEVKMDKMRKERLPDEYYDEEIQERDRHIRTFSANSEEAFADGYAAKINREAVERTHGMSYEAVTELRLIQQRKERQESKICAVCLCSIAD